MAKAPFSSHAASAAVPEDVEINQEPWLYAVVDVADNITYVGEQGRAAVIGKVWVNTALSAHALPIKDGTTTLYSIAASAAANTVVTALENMLCSDGIVIDPNDAATGAIIVQYKYKK